MSPCKKRQRLHKTVRAVEIIMRSSPLGGLWVIAVKVFRADELRNGQPVLSFQLNRFTRMLGWLLAGSPGGSPG